MTTISKRYPFSTADGQAIPLDIIRPRSVLGFSVSPDSASSIFTIPVDIEVMYITSSVDLIVTFTSISDQNSASALVDGEIKNNSIYVPSTTLIVVSPPVATEAFSVISVADTGYCITQYVESWSGLSLQSQQARR